MHTLPTRFVRRHAMLCCHVLTVLAFGCGAVDCRGDEMAAEIDKPLQEFKVKRLQIEKKAEAETVKELDALCRKLETIKKGKNKNPQANEQAAQLLEKIKSPTFLALGLDLLMNKIQVGVSLKGAEAIAAAYKQRQVTAVDWGTFPGDSIVVPAGKKVDAGIDVQEGDFVLVCPHPTQTFRESKDKPWTTFDGRGPNGEMIHPQQLIAKIVSPANMKEFQLKNDVLFQCPIEGRLSIAPRWSPGGEGSITCKVFKVVAR